MLQSLAQNLARLTGQAAPPLEPEAAQVRNILELRTPRTDPGDLPRVLLPPTGTEGGWDADGGDVAPQARNVALDEGMVDSLLQLVPLELAEFDERAIFTGEDVAELSTPSYVLAPIRSLLERRRSPDDGTRQQRAWRLTPLARAVLLIVAAPLGIVAGRWLLGLFA